MVSVSACLVTRGDVDMQPIIDSLPKEWEVVIWDNSGTITRSDGWAEVCIDLSVYGRYAAIEYASHDVIYVQDDDVIVSDPSLIVEQWECVLANTPQVDNRGDFVACNMPAEFRHAFYTEHALVGFGAAFHRDAPQRAFDRFSPSYRSIYNETRSNDAFHRCCDVVFTGLTPRVLVDIEKTNLPYAEDANRMYRQPGHVGERQRMFDLMRKVRDA
jgi:hypothetical protein